VHPWAAGVAAVCLVPTYGYASSVWAVLVFGWNVALLSRACVQGGCRVHVELTGGVIDAPRAAKEGHGGRLIAVSVCCISSPRGCCQRHRQAALHFFGVAAESWGGGGA
jgi:hypothetical protein